MWRHCADCSVTETVNSWWPGIDLLQSCSSLGVWSTGFGPSYLLANVKVGGASASAQNVGQFGFWFYSTTEVACCPILWCSFCSGGSSGTNKLIAGTHRFGGLCMAGRDAEEVWMHTGGCHILRIFWMVFAPTSSTCKINSSSSPQEIAINIARQEQSLKKIKWSSISGSKNKFLPWRIIFQDLGMVLLNLLDKIKVKRRPWPRCREVDSLRK